MRKIKLIIELLIISYFTISCNQEMAPEIMPGYITIGISKTSGSESYEQYSKWLKTADSTIQIIDFYTLSFDSALKALELCDGFLISGGEDISPDYYGLNSRLEECGKIDYRRDTLEFLMVDYAFRSKAPVLGICRGHQMINVVLGGSLFIDLPTDKPSSTYHRYQRADTCRHLIYLQPGTLLGEIAGGDSIFEVNSSHHQAIDIPALNIEPFAFAEDGVVEAAGWSKPEGKSFLLMVQFHPEYLPFDHPLSGNIAKRFLAESILYENKTNKITERKH